MFERAHSLEPAVPMPFERALVGLDDGRRLRWIEDGPGAIARARERLIGIFSDLGADPYVQVCAAELATLQVSAATESPAALLGLSRAELAVARLVATGLTNREVAAELYVSVKTVEYHLRNMFHQARHHLPARARPNCSADAIRPRPEPAHGAPPERSRPAPRENLGSNLGSTPGDKALHFRR